MQLRSTRRVVSSRVFFLGLAAAGGALPGCAALEQARLEQLDKSVQVSARDSMWNHRRVGMEPSSCKGDLCGQMGAADFERQVMQAATGACYEVVEADEIARYAKHYGGPSIGTSFGMNIGEMIGVAGGDKHAQVGAGMNWDMGFHFDAQTPDVRDVVVDELGLQGILKTAVQVDPPDNITGFRPVTIDVRLIDAVGRQNLWQARITEQLMNSDQPGEVIGRLANDLGEALKRRVNACTPPPAPAPVVVGQPQNFDGFQVVEQHIQLPDRIHFELGSAQLSERSHGMLGQVAHFLATRPDIKTVRVEGHTDSDGDDASNLTLSQQRAAAVVAFLTSQGVTASRLTSAGYGETKPVAPNDTIANKAKNRRVDLVIVP